MMLIEHRPESLLVFPYLITCVSHVKCGTFDKHQHSTAHNLYSIDKQHSLICSMLMWCFFPMLSLFKHTHYVCNSTPLCSDTNWMTAILGESLKRFFTKRLSISINSWLFSLSVHLLFRTRLLVETSNTVLLKYNFDLIDNWLLAHKRYIQF